MILVCYQNTTHTVSVAAYTEYTMHGFLYATWTIEDPETIRIHEKYGKLKILEQAAVFDSESLKVILRMKRSDSEPLEHGTDGLTGTVTSRAGVS